MKIKGFTLTEMVVTIVVMGIVFIGTGSYIKYSMSGYVESVARQRLQNQARFVIEKISREIRHAVPNSFATAVDSDGDKCLSFHPIDIAGFYDRNDVNNTVRFVVNNQGARLTTQQASNSRLAINPSQPADLVSGAQSISLAACRNSAAGCTEEDVSSAGTGVYSYILSDSFSSYSIANRYFIYSNQVQYCISEAGDITKSVGSGAKVRVGTDLDYANSSFNFVQVTLQRGGLVHMDLLFVNNGETSLYSHDVQVLNVP